MEIVDRDNHWRPSLAARVTGGMLVVVGGAMTTGFAALAIVSLVRIDLPGVAASLGAATLLAAGAVQLWVLVFRTSLSLEGGQVVVRNPWRTRTIATSDIERIEPGYNGLTITTRSGETVTACAVQKWNLAKWLHRRTRADDVVDRLRTAAS